MDLWNIATDKNSDGNTATGSKLDTQSTLFFVGSSGCGKSTLIQNFLKPNSKKEQKPTFSLEYNFVRRKTQGGKALVHMWELGGDVYEEDLLKVPISSKNIKELTVIVCADLSNPQNILVNTKHWLELIRRTIDHVIASSRNVILPNNSNINNYEDENSTEKSRINPIKIPVIIMATKWDTLKSRTMSTADRRLLFQVLRYLAHYYGASLFCSGLGVDSIRAFLTTLCFQGPIGLNFNNATSLDRPINVLAGTDSFEKIFEDESTNQSTFRTSIYEAIPSSTSSPNESNWKALSDALEEIFDEANPPPDANSQNRPLVDENTYPEHEIDEERVERRAVLERYIMEQQRLDFMRAKGNAKNSSASSKTSSSSSKKDSKDINVANYRNQRDAKLNL